MSDTEEMVLWYFNTKTKKKEKRKVVVTDCNEKTFKPPIQIYNDSGDLLLAFIPLNTSMILEAITDE